MNDSLDISPPFDEDDFECAQPREDTPPPRRFTTDELKEMIVQLRNDKRELRNEVKELKKMLKNFSTCIKLLV